MSGTSNTERSSSSKASTPVELLSNGPAPIVTNVHAALILSAIFLRFQALVVNPVPTLLSALLPLAIIQTGYVVLCLPATGSNSKPMKKAKLNGSTKSAETVPAYAFIVFFSLILSMLPVSVIAVIQILMGAPATTHVAHTLLCSAHIALLAIFPLIYVHGADSGKWREIISLDSPIDEVFGGAVGCILGAWLGAVPIPLDWDREWQKWPVTIVTGAYAGYFVGKLVGAWLLKGKRIKFY